MQCDPTVVPEEAPRRPSQDQDVYIWISCCPAGVPGLMDRQRPQQVWPLLHQPRAQDGHLRSAYQRASGPCYDFPPAKDLCWQDKSEVEAPPDRRLKPPRKFPTDVHVSAAPTDPIP